MTPTRFIPWLYVAVIGALLILLMAMLVVVAMLSTLLLAPPHVPVATLLMTQSVLAIALARVLVGMLIVLGIAVILYAVGAAVGVLKPLPAAPFKRGAA